MKRGLRAFIVITVAVLLVFSVVGCVKEETDDNWQEGSFYSLERAYELGLISREDLSQIAYYQNNKVDCPRQLTASEIADIKNTRAAELRKETDPAGVHTSPDAKAEDIAIDKYYGTYNGCHAVMLMDIYGNYSTALWTDEVDGIKLHYNDGNSILVWCADKSD